MANANPSPQRLHLTPKDRHLVNVNKSKLIDPNVAPPEELVDEARKRFFANFVRNHEAELKYRSLSDLEQFIDSLPKIIHGSGKDYRRSEIGKLIAEVLTGSKTSDYLTSTSDIRKEVEAYMRGQIIQASEQIPNFISEESNPFTGRPIRTYEDRFLHADQALRFAELKPETAQNLKKGYKNVNHTERSDILHQIAEMHGKFMEHKGQNHLYLADRDIARSYKEREKLPSLEPHLKWIQESRKDYDQSTIRQRESMKYDVDRYVDQAMPLLGTEFKVHIHPDFNLIPAIFDRLLVALRMDPHFRLNIDAIKVARSNNDEYNDPQAGVVPHIVIYPHRTTTIQQSHKILSRIIERVEVHLKDLDNPSSSAHETPRYNHQISDIIFMAQCGGDMKGDLKAMGLLDHYFDPNYNHGILRERRHS